ncbi:hypothetical protein [Stigmatella aurantiaca]|uniref:Conserved uncharacterized protein n=1 Tax=Stigmatella aurantiaca (strain DW4/3-1) TaxID=378806 RepID=Q08U54_STIAD|nr:hypothetical protein [Stigmatella aurantiaca]ADO69431.1 conserved uncharacterized protein [Stigmatella aurantiaca DW4/3-1]EAU64009.1 hypothetical protein STIAU_1611 [Stigmatella aurantiaca DW4/3-1]
MGLAERRAAKEFETKRFPQFKKDIDEAAGFEVPVTVQWDTLAKEGESHLYDECWPKVYFEPLIAALKGISFDDMGKEALKAGLKKIEIQNRAGAIYGDRIASFENGTLLLDHQPHTNVDDVRDRTEGIRKLLESKL